MPTILLPNSSGAPEEGEFQEAWSAAARAASARARQRGRNIKRLTRLRQKFNDKLLDQMNQDRAMGKGKNVSPAAGKHWSTINSITGRIQGMQKMHAAAERPLFARLRKKLRKVF